jgi:hypothetical protein
MRATAHDYGLRAGVDRLVGLLQVLRETGHQASLQCVKVSVAVDEPTDRRAHRVGAMFQVGARLGNGFTVANQRAMNSAGRKLA